MYRSRKLQLLLKTKFLTSRVRSHSETTQNEKKIDKILIANRGEIACRISRTAKRLGIKTVAVYSDVERNAMHVDLADEAYCIGPAQSSQSYLRQDKIISVAKQAKCQAIHPGYGFLSENVEFAELCQKESIIFIGPPASAIRDMGIKSYHGDDQSNETLLSEARNIGFPLMIKAIRGGGGKGMRIVLNDNEFFHALESARTESQKAFGDSAVLLERYVDKPRHVEVQIFADKHGDAVYLFERDCSIQRRHQKVIEEAPAPGISKELQLELGETAVRAAKAVGYVGAGTVEFIMDRTNYNFHFMEMNTRLQVEHPVTEAITGLDLVEWQLKVAAGEGLPLKQEEIHLRGHAFETRIYAETPRNDFLPGAGNLSYLRTPETSENVRVETGVKENDDVLVHYDPMIAKLVVWGSDRNEALRILRSKLCEYNITGIDTNIEFIKDLCLHPDFQNGKVHTGFIAENNKDLFPDLRIPNEILIQGALALILYEEMNALSISLKTNNPFSPFATETGLRFNHILNRTFKFAIDNKCMEVSVKYVEPETFSMRTNNIGPWRRVTGTLKKRNNALELNAEIDGIIGRTRVTKLENTLHLFTNTREWRLNMANPKFLSELTKNVQLEESSAVISPMSGIIDKVFVKRGDKIKQGDALVVIVAMKMEYVIKAPADGIVEDVPCTVGDKVSKDELVVKLSE
ncbi:methylcrotonoyl-CoA carboxylase subunit alpha, mitochondrial isoform X2 [Vespa velutina]|uniref:methylcrotonoyl-CoA carboxylase subunit alpha, mitochondrial isoform X2 n=1 Tax=Vespa velutina TaxID=202808 RepID=UPI001FB38BD3|nr:methylcrotonoyl-CoA carboxylase subunit alpha, mitochondrial isoform X2 [Vespa velutina]